MDKHIMAQACPKCGGTEYYCAEEVDQKLAECREEVRRADARAEEMEKQAIEAREQASQAMGWALAAAKGESDE